MVLTPFAAVAASDAREFFTNLFTGALDGDLLSLVVVAIAVLVILRFIAARWVFVLVKQIFIFGGLGYGVYVGGQAAGERWGEGVGNAILYAGEAIVGILFLIMLYMFFLRQSREKEAERRAAAGTAGAAGGGKKVSAGGDEKVTHIGAGPLARQGVPVHERKAAVSPAPTPSDGEESHRVEDVLRKLNVLGASKDQNLLTVMVLILVAEFGVFTSKTIAAPNATVGMVLFAAFIFGAIIFVKTSYQNYWTGVRHFVFATIFAVGLSLLMLVYWQGTYCDTSLVANNTTALEGCSGAAASLEWGVALNPQFYFMSDGLIAAITGVAFSTLLTKGGG